MSKSVLDLIEQEKQPEQTSKNYFDIDEQIASEKKREQIAMQLGKTKSYLFQFVEREKHDEISYWLYRGSHVDMIDNKKILFVKEKLYNIARKYSTIIKESGIDEIKPLEKK